ncbi:hypothetical protein [Wolbachia endosymbiont of Ctenocephalides felis wCfeT]|uniref:hypothetical protein n=1 Tax=Wolbachia endosymbiont of Ctenocephalides felis wCfeT TaxID=2732593 RepID=UPI001445F414|nr:hypothetical protein [Wolbachia endosymbiont of Ctenocephalides felis wCfeT]
MSILSILLFISLLLLNTSNKLMICAALFIGSALVIHSIAEFYGRKQAIYGLIMCTVLCCILKLQNFSLMILFSYAAIIISLLSGIIIFDKLRSKFNNFHIANFTTLIIASVIDSAVVCAGLLYKFPVDKCLSIYMRDLIFKFSYASILSLCLLAGVQVFLIVKEKYLKHSA